MAVRARRLSQQQRLDRLEREHEQALDKMAAGMFGAADRREVARRNVERGKTKRKTARAAVSMQKRGLGTPELRLRKTVKQEQRAAVERKVEAFIAANPDHPVARAWTRRTQEIDELRAARRGGSFLEDEPAGGRVHVKAYCVKPHTRRVRVRAA